MTINIQPTPLPVPPITVHAHVQDGVEGYLFRTNPPFFIPEHEADQLARYFLFGRAHDPVDKEE